MEGLGLGVLIGIGLVGLKRVARPIAKGAIKLGLLTAEAMKDAFHEGRETLLDLVAEVRHELEAAPAGAAARGKAEPPPAGVN